MNPSLTKDEYDLDGHSQQEADKTVRTPTGRQIRHWAFACFGFVLLFALLASILSVGNSESSEHTWAPSPSPWIQAYAPSPTPLPTRNLPTAFVDTRVATIFDNIGTAAEVLLELHEGDRVQVLAQSSDEIWTRIRIEDKHVGWIRTYRLVMAEASQTPTSTADTQVSPGFALREVFENAERGWGSETDENG